MADSDTTIDQISPGMAQKEVVVNANFDAASPSMGYGRRASTTEALTWGYHEATVDVSGVPTEIAAGTIALTASATNYLYRTSAGVVTKVTSAPTGWPGPITSPAGAIALYTIVTGASTVTSYDDHRLSTGPPGAAGAGGPPDAPFVTLTDGTTVNTDASLGHNFYLLIGGNRTLANPTNLSDGQVINFVIKQDGTGTRTLAYGSKFKFANGSSTLSTPANSIDLISGVYHSGLDLVLCCLAKAIA